MRTYATLKNLRTPKDKNVIIRNLNRILNLVILDVDIESATITLLHDNQTALEHAKRELKCIGFPAISLSVGNGQKPINGTKEKTI